MHDERTVSIRLAQKNGKVERFIDCKIMFNSIKTFYDFPFPLNEFENIASQWYNL